MRYILKTKGDLEILKLCNKLLKGRLSKSDRSLVLMIKTQLESDWRKYLLIKLSKLVKKYDK